MSAIPQLRRRAVLVLVATTALTALAAGLATTAATALTAIGAPGPARLDDAVLALAAAGAAAVAGWLALGTAVSVAGLLSGRDRHPRVLPAALHRLVAVALGVALAGVSVPASASGPASWPAVPPPAATSVAPSDGASAAAPGAVDPGWTPPAPPPAVRRAEPADPVVVAPPRPAVSAEHAVAVRRGDTLWDIAARHLPAGSTDAEIAAAWPRWYAANAAVVGADPDLLLPGQLLRAPADAG